MKTCLEKIEAGQVKQMLENVADKMCRQIGSVPGINDDVLEEKIFDWLCEQNASPEEFADTNHMVKQFKKDLSANKACLVASLHKKRIPFTVIKGQVIVAADAVDEVTGDVKGAIKKLVQDLVGGEKLTQSLLTKIANKFGVSDEILKNELKKSYDLKNLSIADAAESASQRTGSDVGIISNFLNSILYKTYLDSFDEWEDAEVDIKNAIKRLKDKPEFETFINEPAVIEEVVEIVKAVIRDTSAAATMAIKEQAAKLQTKIFG